MNHSKIYGFVLRHVNRSSHPNVSPDFEKKANIALRDIAKGEEIFIAQEAIEDF